MMDVLKWVPLLILVVLILILLIGNIVIVQQSKAYVVERLGAFRAVWGVGLHLKIPFIERVAKKVSLKEQVADFAPQPVITKDNVTMQIDTVIYFQITDPKLYAYGVERPMNAIENLTATTLRNIIGEMELDQSLTSRDTINAKMRAILDEATDPWGIKVNRVELKNIIPPKEIQNAMEKQMKAERERRESILQAEGQKQSQILVAEGEKQGRRQAGRHPEGPGRERGPHHGRRGGGPGHHPGADRPGGVPEAAERGGAQLPGGEAEGSGGYGEGGGRQGYQDHHSQRAAGIGGACRQRQGDF